MFGVDHEKIVVLVPSNRSASIDYVGPNRFRTFTTWLLGHQNVYDAAGPYRFCGFDPQRLRNSVVTVSAMNKFALWEGFAVPSSPGFNDIDPFAVVENSHFTWQEVLVSILGIDTDDELAMGEIEGYQPGLDAEKDVRFARKLLAQMGHGYDE